MKYFKHIQFFESTPQAGRHAVVCTKHTGISPQSKTVVAGYVSFANCLQGCHLGIRSPLAERP